MSSTENLKVYRAMREFANSHPDNWLMNATTKGYVCPLCGNGSGSDGDGISANETGHYKCFRCGAYGDIVQFVALSAGLDGSSAEAAVLAAKLCGYRGEFPKGRGRPRKKAPRTPAAANEPANDAAELVQTSMTDVTAEPDSPVTGAADAVKTSAHDAAVTFKTPMTGAAVTFKTPMTGAAVTFKSPVTDASVTSAHGAARVVEIDTSRDADFSAYLRQCEKMLGETDYLRRRGISDDVGEKFHVGYDPAWRSPKAVAEGHDVPASPRLIIPSGDGYIARDVRADIPPAERKYAKMRVGGAATFGADECRGAEFVFVVEGEIDAMSVWEALGCMDGMGDVGAVALGSTARAGAFLRETLESARGACYILSLDGDTSGRTAQRKLAQGFLQYGVRYIEADVNGAGKDANEALCADRGTFCADVTRVVSAARSAAARTAGTVGAGGAAEAAGDSTAADKAIGNGVSVPAVEGEKKSNARYLRGMLEGRRGGGVIGTGVRAVDSIIGGGWARGSLSIIGGVTGAGKTSLLLQSADAAAAAGGRVLYCTYEMSREELLAKSLSAAMYRTEPTLAVSADVILRGGVSGASRGLLERVCGEYAAAAALTFTLECGANDGAAAIRAAAAELEPDLICVDYLQIMPGAAGAFSEKQAVDETVSELKRTARDRGCAVVAISAFNRQNYAQVKLEAFKQSGGIEYSADLLLGLTPERVTVLKNRFGAANTRADVRFVPAYSCYE